MPNAGAFTEIPNRYHVIFLSPSDLPFQVQRCWLRQVLKGGARCRCRADGVPWVIKPGDYMSSFSFLRALVSTKVLVSDKVLTLAKVLTALKMLTKILSILTKDLKYVDKRLN